MIYLIGGAPRAGKTILVQQLAETLGIGWISTDILQDLLRFNNHGDTKVEWNGTPEAIVAKAENFFPYLERFVWGANSLSDNYAVEGVDFLPAHVIQLSMRYPIRSVFLGCSDMTLERFDQFPGRSRGYAGLPMDMRRQIVHDVPLWSDFIRQEAEKFGFAYVDMSDDFPSRLNEVEAFLVKGVVPTDPI